MKTLQDMGQLHSRVQKDTAARLEVKKCNTVAAARALQSADYHLHYSAQRFCIQIPHAMGIRA
jgi:hypothetical protein